MSRKLEFGELLSVLMEEHVEVKQRMKYLQNAQDKGDYEGMARISRELTEILRQHIIDEESRILRILIGAYGRLGAGKAISVFRQHRPIFKLLQDISMATAPELRAWLRSELEELLLGHCEVEEKKIFPWALKTYRESIGVAGTAKM